MELFTNFFYSPSPIIKVEKILNTHLDEVFGMFSFLGIL